MASKTRYTAVVRIIKVNEYDGKDGPGRIVASEKKDSQDIVQFTVRSSDLDSLVEKTKGHLDLVDEDND